jgi:hypothetical protein
MLDDFAQSGISSGFRNGFLELEREAKADLDDPWIFGALYLAEVGGAAYDNRASETVEICAVESIQPPKSPQLRL